jgi:hypothetical protein
LCVVGGEDEDPVVTSFLFVITCDRNSPRTKLDDPSAERVEIKCNVTRVTLQFIAMKPSPASVGVRIKTFAKY